jgi:hypothetical protein
MGVTASKTKKGISQYEIYTLIGLISQIFDDVVNNITNVDNARSVINYHLHRVKRHLYTPNQGDTNRIFPNGQIFILINEKYFDVDGVHAWGIVLQMKPGSKIAKILHADPEGNTNDRISEAPTPSGLDRFPPRQSGNPGNQGNHGNPGNVSQMNPGNQGNPGNPGNNMNNRNVGNPGNNRNVGNVGNNMNNTRQMNPGNPGNNRQMNPGNNMNNTRQMNPGNPGNNMNNGNRSAADMLDEYSQVYNPNNRNMNGYGNNANRYGTEINGSGGQSDLTEINLNTYM